jgi:hypothetical protein
LIAGGYSIGADQQSALRSKKIAAQAAAAAR